MAIFEYTFDTEDLEDGRHKVRVVVTNIAGRQAEDEVWFVIDTIPPVIDISSPVANKTYSDYPLLLYTVYDVTTGLRRVDVTITNQQTGESTNYGWLRSGMRLDFLHDGVYTITIEAEDLAIGVGDKPGNTTSGNKSEKGLSFTFVRDVVMEKGVAAVEAPRWLYIGSDFNGEHQVDSIMEELRILNKASTEADITNDFKILNAGIRLQNRLGSAILTSTEEQTLDDVEADKSRANLPDNTLALFHFDSNVDSEPGVGILAEDDTPLLSEKASTNDIHITVKHKESDGIDKDLITRLLNKIKLAHTELVIDFELVED